jgi:UDP-N-acetylglucosamine transferase subunit ALG13
VILVTVGTQLPFDRLIEAIDDAAPALGQDVFAQIGSKSTYVPRNFEFCHTMTPGLMEQKFGQADRIVSHAGTGSVLMAKKHGKPIILFPRRAAMKEHRNDHQLATCRHLEGRPGIFVAYDIENLRRLMQMETLSATDVSEPAGADSGDGRSRLIEGLARFIRMP